MLRLSRLRDFVRPTFWWCALIRRKTPLARGAPPKRTGRPKAVNKKRRSSTFARAYYSKAYVKHIHAMPCFACGKEGETDAAHGATGGMSHKADYDTLLPLCRRCHTKQHQSGWLSIGMTAESRERAARMTWDTFTEKYAQSEED